MEFAQIYDPVSPTGISLDENDRFLVGDKISDDTYEVIDTLGHDESTENENDKWVAKIEVVTPTRHQGLNPFFRTLTPLYREGNESYPYLASMSGTEIPWTPATAARVSHSLKTLVDNGRKYLYYTLHTINHLLYRHFYVSFCIRFCDSIYLSRHRGNGRTVEGLCSRLYRST